MAEVFVRRNAWDPEAGEILRWYATGVGAMKERDPENPTSWTYQAAMHGSSVEPAQPLWNECKHGSWHFLVWHRMYLYYFEQIVRQAVVEAGGPEDWALPYWNYGLGGEQATIPAPFRSPAEESNPLFVEQRAPGINDEEEPSQIAPEIGSDAAALERPQFAGQFEFGGGEAQPEFFFGEAGIVEQTPHGVVHSTIGGPGGWMSSFQTAAQDPIFWLHHANIDRIWATWNANGGADPEAGEWLDQEFEFFDVNGGTVRLKCSETLQTIPDLNYTYDSLPEPAPEPEPEPEPEGAVVEPAEVPQPKVVGASEEQVTLVGNEAAVPVEIDPRARQEVSEATRSDDPRRVVLNVEDIEAEVNPASVYGIYVNLPENPDGKTLEAHHAGNLSFFGIEQARSPKGEEKAHPLRVSVEVGQLLDRLGIGEDEEIKVSFLPINLIRPEEGPKHGIAGSRRGVAAETATEGEDPPVQIGRVSLSVTK
ncbi:MAG TPA: tyrosinase family protein [Solirubrobacterales bacterium]|nr:tyrosinase family protein [Solirubrobacterales bacterium]